MPVWGSLGGATTTNQYAPDYAVPPGRVLDEPLEARGISHAEFARRCGRSPKLISEIMAGKAPLEPGTALQFECSFANEVQVLEDVCPLDKATKEYSHG